MATAIRKNIAAAAVATAAAIAPVGAALSSPAAAPAADAMPACDPSTSPVDENIGQVPEPMPGAKWTFDGKTTNIDNCKDLSYAAITTEGGTASSPEQLMLFHKGQYVGVGTEHNAAYQRIINADDSSVSVQYGVPGSANADVDWKDTVTYHWVGDHVEMDGNLPSEMTQ